MEKITLKPITKEFLYKGNEPGVALDAFSYQGGTHQEKSLGVLSLVGHTKFGQEDMSYLISLVSSLAKREFYSETSLREQDPRAAFERMLKKVNEVLIGFFDKKEFKLNLGLLAVSGENIFISKLGKFKVALARDGKYIDILNNIELFNKDMHEETQFSNIISGRIKPNDKIFAYFPNRQITTREKAINPIFMKGDNEKFSEKIAQLASSSKGFACCGVYIDMKEVREIPIRSAFPDYSGATLTEAPSAQTPPAISPSIKKYGVGKDDEKDEDKEGEPEPKIEPGEKKSEDPAIYEYEPEKDTKKNKIEEKDEEEEEDATTEDGVNSPAMQHQKVMAAELSVGKRNNVFTTLAGKFSNFRSPRKLNSNSKRKLFATLAVVIVVPLIAFVLFRGGDSSETKQALSQAQQNLNSAKTQIGQNDSKAARSSLQAALLSLINFNSDKIEKTKTEINQTLDSLNKINEKQPALFIDWTETNKEAKAELVTMVASKIYVLMNDGSVFLADSGNITDAGKVKPENKFLLGGTKSVIAFDGSGIVTLLNPTSKATESISLANAVNNISATFYESNLYTLSENKIYKYTDISTGSSKGVQWGVDDQSGNLISLAIDGNIYGLNSDGKLIKYFKGQKQSELDLQIIPTTGSKLCTSTDSAFIYLADKSAKKVYIFGKNDGILKTTYKLDSAGEVKDIYIASDGTVVILSESRVWKIAP